MRYNDIDRALRAAGYVLTGSYGRNFLYVNRKSGKRAVVPDNGTADIALGTLKRIEGVTGIVLHFDSGGD